MRKKIFSFVPWCLVPAIIMSWGLFSALAGAGENIIIDAALVEKNITPFIYYLEDAGTGLSLEEAIKKKDWKRSNKPSLNFGYTRSVFWCRFTMENRSQETIESFLELEYSPLDDVEFYRPGADGKYTKTVTGDHYPFKQREMIDRNFIFKVKAPPGFTTCYFRIETTSSVIITLIVRSWKGLIARYNADIPIFWLYYGFLIIMVIYNLIIFISTLDRTYLYYVMMISFIVLVELTLEGFAFQYLWPRATWWQSQSVPIIMCLLGISLALFIKAYMQTDEKFVYFNRFLNYAIIAPFSIVLSSSFFISSVLATRLGAPFAVLIVISLFFFSIYAVLKKSRPARFVVLAFSAFFVGVSLFILYTFGFIPHNPFSRWGVQIGSTTMVVLFSLGLADRINFMRKELKALSQNLEVKVIERTEELNSAMKELETTNKNLEVARDALWGEMQLAKRIQTVLLPAAPSIDGYEISAYMAPADDVGGDYYDVINVSGRDWIVIGDVSGHGVSAGLIMMMVQTSIHSVLEKYPELTPSLLLETVNRVIARNIKLLNENKYMTITVLACHDAGSFHFSGLHQDIMIYRSGKKEIELIETDGMWIGMMDDIVNMNENKIFTLDINDIVLLYTDGITESSIRGNDDRASKSLSFFGPERLSRVFCDLSHEPVEKIREGILAALEGYKSDDDITMVIMKRVV